MQDQRIPTRCTRVTQPWTDIEVEKLEDLASRADGGKAELLVREFPNRTLGAVRVKLAQVRRSLGIEPTSTGYGNTTEAGPAMLDPKDEGLPNICWQERRRPYAEEANRAFLNALLRLA